MMKSFIFRITLWIITLLQFPVLTFANSDTTSSKIPHFIFFIHGIGGNDDSFGKMPLFLPVHLNNQQDRFDYQAHVFSYSTENNEHTTTYFARMFSEFMSQKIVQSGVADGNYSISIIAHSQGGLIATIWYHRIAIQDSRFHAEHRSKIHTVITLGTPFWGSKVASLTSTEETPWYTDTIDRVRPMLGIGERQLNDLALTSSTVQEIRQNLYKIAPSFLRDDLPNIRFLNVSGNANLKRITENSYQEKSGWFSSLLPFVFGTVEYESDGAVLIPSSTINTIYHRDIRDDYQEGVLTSIEDSQHIILADRLFVRTVHASSNPNDIQDMSYVPELCYQLTKCSHPVYRYIVDYMLGKPVPTVAPDVKHYNFGEFTVELNVRLPIGFEHLRDQVKVYFNPICYNKLTINEETIYRRIGSSVEIGSSSKAVSKKYSDSVFFWYSGHLYRRGDNKTLINKAKPLPTEQQKVEVIVTAPGLKERRILLDIQPTLTSFADINLVPK